jgi:D-glycero-alpha-D-manno-heptose-7-phosphate kinase
MIISKTPFRVSLFGGSTDYESFYSKFGSFLIGFCLNKYTYLSARKTPLILPYKTRLTYSKTEILNSNEDIQHSAIKGVLDYCKVEFGLELNHFSDLPSQTGTGSSSSFIVGLLNSLYALTGKSFCKKRVAQMAIEIERKILDEPGGVQDQIWASYGGLNSINIKTCGDFEVKPMPVSEEFKSDFISRSILVYTGKTRKSFEVARAIGEEKNAENKKRILETSKVAYESFLESDIEKIGALLEDSWELKKRLSHSISSSDVDILYSELKNNGMIGGKLLGAGRAGFIFGIMQDEASKLRVKKKYKNNYIDFTIDEEGSKIINR